MSPPVLIIEDDDDSRVMLATILTLQGYRVVTATNGVEGLSVARQHQPCLILLDLMMPVMDGEQFRNVQRTDKSIGDIPVVLVTAKNDGRAIAQRMGARCCIQKPLMFDELVRCVSEHCAGADAEQRLHEAENEPLHVAQNERLIPH
jgi:two-component system, chemotaxis family, chemotaxis protein CheY